MKIPGRYSLLTFAFLLLCVFNISFADTLERRAVRAGWDLVSVPGAAEDTDLCEVVGGEEAAVFDLRERAYRSCADGPVVLEPGRAYWVYLPSSGELDFPRTEGAPRVDVVVREGWNLIGAPTDDIVPWDDSVLVNGVPLSQSSCLRSKPFAYDPVSGGYKAAAVLEPWRGYAVLAAGGCTVTFPGEGEGKVEIVYADLLPDTVVELAGGGRAVEGQYVVRKADGADEGEFLRRVSEAGGVVRGVNAFLGIYQVEFSGDVEAAAAALQAAAEVAGAAPNIVFSLGDFTPDDPPYAAGAPGELSWAFGQIGAPKVWSDAPQAAAPVIAVVDTGVDGAHTDLAGRVTAGAGFVVSGDPADTDPHGHGTHIAGIAAAGGNNGTGIAGVCWNCRVMPVKVCDAGGDCPFFSVLNGITYAANTGADVINISLTANVAADSPARRIFQDVIDYAQSKGAFVVAAAGNDGADAAGTIPASLDGVFTVAATEQSDGRAAFSNFGGAVDIAAPGLRVYSLEPGGGAGYRDGTSAAAGFVSGAVGLVLTLQPTLTSSEVEELLTSTAAPVTSAEPLGAGRLDLAAVNDRMYPSNQPPEIIEFKISETEVKPGEAVEVSFRATDPDGDPVSYTWSVSAGALSTTSSTTTDWTLPATRGVYRVTVRVSDGRGGNASEERKVVVGAADIGILRVHPSAIVLKQGESVELKAYGILLDGNRVTVVPDWRLDAPVGVINGNRLTATADGEATLTASIGTVEKRVGVLVNEDSSFPPLTVAGFLDAGVTFEGDWHEAIVIGDLNGDGLNDIVVGQDGGKNYVYFNNGGSPPTFTQFDPDPTDSYISNTTFLELGDIDNDGDLDLIEAGDGQGWLVYENAPPGTLGYWNTYGAGKQAQSARLADVDNDGDLDLIGAVSLNGDTSYVYFNDGSGNFAAIPPQSVGYSADITQRIEPADLDYDGDVDLVIANLFSGDLVFENVGGVFSDTLQNLGGVTGHITLADVNGDGYIDLLQSDVLADVVNVFSNDGAGVLTFTSAGSFDNQMNLFLDAGDLWDNDGDLDVVTAPDAGDQRVYQNNGVGGFPTFQGPFGIAARAVRVGDLDGDGNLDFANASDMAETFGLNEVFINDGLPGPNSAPSSPAGLASNVTATDVEFTWNASTDAESPANLLTYDLRVGSASGGNDVFSGAVKAGPGNIGHPDIGGTLKHALDLSLFTPGVTYYWSVRAVDTQYIRSGWVEDSFTILAPAGTCNAAWEVRTDSDDPAVNDTLRACIEAANITPGTKTITFDPAFDWDANPIVLNNVLNPAPTLTITNAAGGNTIINNNIFPVKEVTVDGNDDLFDCFEITSANNEIRGLTIVKCNNPAVFPYNIGVHITGAAATLNTIAGNYIGTNSASSIVVGNNIGVYVTNGANNNTIGGALPADRNIVSGNSSYGVYIIDAGSDFNEVRGNYVGTNVAGAAAIGNSNGVIISQGAQNNTIGGTNPGPGCVGECNLISSNPSMGVGLVGIGTDGNEVIGNYIGTDVSGAAALGNNGGVVISTSATNNMIGGAAAGEANLIAYNAGAGVYVEGFDTDYNTISRNRIYENTGLGIELDGAGANDDIAAPVIASITPAGPNYDVSVTVAACPAAPCTVELFCVDDPLPAGIGVDPDGTGAGEAFYYLDSVTGAPYDFTVDVATPCPNTTELTATVTDAIENTSEFAANEPLPTTLCPSWQVTDAADTLTLGTLRQCITEANADGVANTITFTIASTSIQPASPLPTLSDASGGTTIDATGQDITIDGSLCANCHGFEITEADNAIKGLTIINFSSANKAAIYINTDAADNNTVSGCEIGTDGAAAFANNHGVWINDSADLNTIGGTTPAERNIISGNSMYGVYIFGNGTTGNKVKGNYIGTDSAGTAAIPNGMFGVQVMFGATSNVVGGSVATTAPWTCDGDCNVISGNTSSGVVLTSAGASANEVKGNYIGIDVNGAALPNIEGIWITNAASLNVIGGTGAGERNIISGNTWSGVRIDNSTGNTVKGNYIGTDVNGTAARANNIGVEIINAATGNVIGGDSAAGEGNLISGNTWSGVRIDGSDTNVVKGNYIGTDPAGTAARANNIGVEIINAATGNTIGGDSTAGEGNLISGNTTYGVDIDGAGTTLNEVKGNYIGTDVNGTAALANNEGVRIDNGATGNTVGGDSTAGEGNLLSGNTTWGVQIYGAGTDGNKVTGNYVGTDVTGTVALGNNEGVGMLGGAQNNTVGGTNNPGPGCAGECNLLSGNPNYGAGIGSGSDGNEVIGNYIGTDVSGTVAIGNGYGVVISNGPMNNTIGGNTSNKRNIISGNTLIGVIIYGAGTDGNAVKGNYIGTDVNGTAALANNEGVRIDNGAAGNTIGGDSTLGEGNVISGNGAAGVEIDGPGTTGNSVKGNYIGTDVTGAAALANDIGVGIALSAANNTVGGATAGERNIISGNTDYGVVISDFGTDDNKVTGNYIGTDVTGTAALGNNDGISIFMFGPKNNTIGGIINLGPGCAGECNLISGNSSDGVIISESGTDGNKVTGNYIGTDVTGTAALGNGSYGIWIWLDVRSNNIGGSAAGEANLIAYNGGSGVYVEGADTDYNTISRNRIYENTGLGIELDGAGANEDIQPPTINSISPSGANYDVEIDLSGCTTADCNVELFCVDDPLAGINPDGSGAGEGFYFLGDSGFQPSGVPYTFVNIDVATPCPNTTELTATITSTDGNTSEFAVNELLPAADTCDANPAIVSDLGDAVPSNPNTLRRCIEVADADGAATTIDFSAAISPGTITLVDSLPPLTEAFPTTIQNTSGGEITVDGNNGGFDCFTIESANNEIRGLTIVLCDGAPSPSGITLNGASATGNTIAGNYIGTNSASAAGLGNGPGIFIFEGANNNTIGGTLAADRNIISGNTGYGIWLDGGLTGGTDGNIIIGNYIGTNVAGDAALANMDGISIQFDVKNNIIGGLNPGERNIISGNTQSGINFNGPGSDGNQIIGNYIGTNVAGDAAVGNRDGISNAAGANNVIDGNVISGNGGHGILIWSNGSDGNTITGNYIGTNANGTAAIGNSGAGAMIRMNPKTNTVGGATAAERNIISGNRWGVYIGNGGADGNIVIGNYIGTDKNGANSIPNTENGVYIINGGSNNEIGGSAAGEGNVISGNSVYGVAVDGAANNSNSILGNYIGTNAAGDSALPNTSGIAVLNDAQSTIVGGTGANDGNVISGNVVGISINASNGTDIKDNLIGTRPDGVTALANSSDAIQLTNGAQNTVIGGTGLNEANVIANSGFGGNGVALTGGTTDYNRISGNSIYSNAGDGISLGAGSNDNLAIPVIECVSDLGGGSYKVEGTKCNNCTAEIFRADNTGAGPAVANDTYGEGYFYLGQDAAAGTAFSQTLTIADGNWVSATNIDGSDNTSEFALSVDITAAAISVGAVTFTPDNIIADGLDSTIITAVVTDPNGACDIKTVTIDLSLLGMSPTETLYDDGTNGDAVADDGTFTLGGITATVPPVPSGGTYTFTVTAEDYAGSTDTGTDDLTINAPPTVSNVTFSPNPAANGGSVTAYATVTDANGAGPTPAGDISTVVIDLTDIGCGAATGMTCDSGCATTSAVYKAVCTISHGGPFPASENLTVTATDSMGQSDSDSGTLQLVEVAPKPPTSVTATNNAGVVDLTWLSPWQYTDDTTILDPLTEHRIYRRLKSGSYGAPTFTDPAATATNTAYAYADNTVVAFEEYCYAITAVSSTSVESAKSSEACVTAMPEPYKFLKACGNVVPGVFYPPDTPGIFHRPVDIVADGNGFIYVADTDNHRVQKLDEDCNYNGHWGSLGAANGEFKAPTGIAYANGEVFVVDNYDRVQAFSDTGVFLRTWEVLLPINIEYDAGSGNLYVSTEWDWIYVYQTDGTYVTKWKAVGVKHLDFDAAGNLYYAQPYVDKVRILDSGGSPAGEWGEPGAGIGQLDYPFGLAIDGSGLVFVSEVGNNRMQVFDTAGALKNVIPNSDTGYDPMQFPTGITTSAFSGKTRVFLCDKNTSRLLLFEEP